MLTEDLIQDVLTVTSSILSNKFTQDLLLTLKFLHVYMSSIHKDPYK